MKTFKFTPYFNDKASVKTCYKVLLPMNLCQLFFWGHFFDIAILFMSKPYLAMS